MTRCPDQGDVGAYVLDVLEPDERERMRRHLASCAACSADLDELAALPTHLAAVPAPDVLGGPRAVPPSARAFRRLRADARSGGRGRRRRRALTAATGLVVAAAVAGGAVLVRTADAPPEPDVVTAEAGAVRARAALTETHNGTRVALTLGGVPASEQCRLVAVGRSGQRQTAGTWTASGAGEASVTGWLSMASGDIDRLVIETLDGTPLLTLPSPQG